MAAPTDILDKQKDLAPYFGIDCDSDEAKLLWLIQRYVESAARSFVRHGITETTYTEFQRKTDIGNYDAGSSGNIELVGADKVYTAGTYQHHGTYLQLDNGFVRSVATVHEDFSAVYGQGSDDFAASTLLTAATDYYVELDESGLSRSGRLIRRFRGWSTRPGSIKITYTAGLAPSELDGEYSFVKMALLEEISGRYNKARSQQNSGFGPLKKITYFGDYQEEYAVDAKTAVTTGLSHGTANALQPLKSMVL